jgi:hypothetical protein
MAELKPSYKKRKLAFDKRAQYFSDKCEQYELKKQITLKTFLSNVLINDLHKIIIEYMESDTERFHYHGHMFLQHEVHYCNVFAKFITGRLGFSEKYTDIVANISTRQCAENDTSHNTYLPLAFRQFANLWKREKAHVSLCVIGNRQHIM